MTQVTLIDYQRFSSLVKETVCDLVAYYMQTSTQCRPCCLLDSISNMLWLLILGIPYFQRSINEP